ncbi:hypothetical protein pb186bvf_013123 [Paramecium bursaria]
MGCAAHKQMDRQTNIKLPIQSNTCQTEADLDDTQGYLQIGICIKGLGLKKQNVQEVFDKVGTLYPQLDEIQYEFLLMPDESIFYGQLTYGKRHGIGRQHWQKEGNYLEGTWIEDQLNGLARMIYPNGDYFEGMFHNNMANGYGKFVSPKKEVSGQWIQNKLNGMGQEKRSSGTLYQGKFQDGKIHGNGTFKWSNLTSYSGQVYKGRMHGNGILVFQDDSQYQGEFKNNGIQGKGKYINSNNEIMEGWFHSKYEDRLFKLYYFTRETQVLNDFTECLLIQKPLSSYFD